MVVTRIGLLDTCIRFATLTIAYLGVTIRPRPKCSRQKRRKKELICPELAMALTIDYNGANISDISTAVHERYIEMSPAMHASRLLGGCNVPERRSLQELVGANRFHDSKVYKNEVLLVDGFGDEEGV